MRKYYDKILSENRVILTERLILRPHKIDDLNGVFEMSSSKEALKYLIWEGVSTPEQARHAIESFYPSCPAMFAIEIKETGEYFGNLDVRPVPEHEKASFGFMSRPQFWGNGYMTEALTAVLRFCFEKVGFHRVEAAHFIDNKASGRVMEKSGMYYEGTGIDEIKLRGNFETQCHYGVTKDIWLKENQK